MHSLTLDHLTGSANLLAFADWLLAQRASNEAFSLVVIDLNGVTDPESAVRTNALRWVALVLREELPGTVYRIGAEEFVALLSGADQVAHRRVAQRLAARLDFEAERLGLHPPAVALGLVHYGHTQAPQPVVILSQIQQVITAARQAGAPPVTVLRGSSVAADDLTGVVASLVQRLAVLGAQLEASQHLAHIDTVTGLPNLHAAYERASLALVQAAVEQKPCAFLLIDGDDLRRYNQIGYAAGDKLLNDLSATLREQLRPSDLLARWRMGDEFLVILPNTGVSGAASLADRLRRRIENVSQYWPFRVTISIGVAAFPQHGEDVQQLIEQVEAAKERAKRAGKNRAMVAGTG
jgi:diguanylate cyclase (GGDEF)-like protein